ncbi:DNA-3-methyladenine glycosylase 2 family protein [Flexivirga sp. ID2601S]|uniref:DNA-3-methyladenine glycosylase 2 family protein n=1 Tax=Flexivirga aerilata TaxID=1656889 RepID=A0A849ADG7_9MICO|nr:DNA-3-methyladenine glycosylase 2 family protein [Flexivirga aerilata]NNG38499.1 DNA-3-methyladenine glycosylase 2 family protein [Flexivirga aerilata]
MSSSTTLEIEPRGPFDLRASAAFLAGFTPLQDTAQQPAAPEELVTAFTVDGEWSPQGVRVLQDPDGTVRCQFASPAGSAARDQVRRMLCLDIDGSALDQVAARDPHVADLMRRAPGLRPVLFASPYEAAAWSVLSQRVRMTQAAAVRARLCAELGDVVDIAGVRRTVFPRPDTLLRSAADLSLPDTARDRLQAVARAALDGQLDAAMLRSLDPQDALRRLLTIHGIGPFSAELTLVRGAGSPDMFPAQERRLRKVLSRVYHHSADDDQYFAEVSRAWSPLRSWVCFLFRTTEAIPLMFSARKLTPRKESPV